MPETTLTIHTDGAARGNPGPAAFSYVISQHGAPDIEDAGCLGRMTNNQAEYTALVRALERAAQDGANHRLVILSDSELLVKQMRREYRVKDSGLRDLYEQAEKLRVRFPAVEFRHIRREQNRRADELCNEALDGQRGTSASSTKKHDAKPTRSAPPDAVRDEFVACLRTVASAWARGTANEPSPEDVFDQLWSILEDQGVLRQPRSR